MLRMTEGRVQAGFFGYYTTIPIHADDALRRNENGLMVPAERITRCQSDGPVSRVQVWTD